MKKFLIAVVTVIMLVIVLDYSYYHMGIYVDFGFNDKPVTAVAKTEGKQIFVSKNGTFEEFEIKGVDMGSGHPGAWSTEFSIDKETYKRWFGYIKDMGANTIRVYTINSQPFYDAFYEFNKDNPDPLYMIHGVWVNDYVHHSHHHAYSDEFYGMLEDGCRVVCDIIHGKRKLNVGGDASSGHGTYIHDISDWVIGYLIGVEWEDTIVCYTDEKFKDQPEYTGFKGEYMYTAEGSSPFEAMLARLGDKLMQYETNRYGEQRLIAFSNWPTTDPFEYPFLPRSLAVKRACVNVENVLCTDKIISGQFASYHVYPYFPDYLTFVDDWTPYGIKRMDYYNTEGQLNTYRAYLTMLNSHHTMPVVISEFGIPTSRAMAHEDIHTKRNQGLMNEQQQGQALAECYYDIIASGCSGCCIFSWQDEWFKRTWNTMHAIDMRRNPYWSDYQTNEQYFGLLSFDPGKEKSVCYVDGNVSEWTQDDLVSTNGDLSLSMKYDEKFIYFLIEKKNLDFGKDVIYVPLDITPKSGSNYCENYGLKFNREIDFIIRIEGATNSRVLVQERYEALRSTYSYEVYKFDTYEKGNIPDKSSPVFKNIDLILHRSPLTPSGTAQQLSQTFETGLLKFGNANPESADFDSLADFISKGDFIEIKLPWQLLNFSDPSKMNIHDDYYDDNYGIFHLNIDSIYAGICQDNAYGRTVLEEVKLEGWGNYPTFHERLKRSYYVIQDVWSEDTP